MPLIGLGLHIILALVCAVHAVRTGQPMYWLLILFMFPLLGSVVYFLAVYLPQSRLERGAKRAVKAAVRTIDPTRDLRQARAQFEDMPTAQNQMRLAAALLADGQANEAADLYTAALKGPFASDLELKYAAAQALIESGRAAEALAELDAIVTANADFRPSDVPLLRARALAGCGRTDEARAAFETALARSGSFEAHAEYAIWALTTGDAAADRLCTEVDLITRRQTPTAREHNEPTLRRYRAAREQASPQG